MRKNCSNLLELKCDLITGITEISHKLKVKYAIIFLFLLGSTLSIPISPILAASDIDNDGILDDVDIVLAFKKIILVKLMVVLLKL